MRKTPLKKINPKRKKRLRAQNYGAKADWILTHPCCVCGGKSGKPTIPAHAPYTKAARPGNKWLLPFCTDCEQKFHNRGVATFAKLHGLTVKTLEEMAEQWDREWRNEEKEQR